MSLDFGIARPLAAIAEACQEGSDLRPAAQRNVGSGEVLQLCVRPLPGRPREHRRVEQEFEAELLGAALGHVGADSSPRAYDTLQYPRHTQSGRQLQVEDRIGALEADGE